MSATDYQRLITCLTASALIFGMNRWVLIDFLLCSKHRLEMSMMQGAVHGDVKSVYKIRGDSCVRPKQCCLSPCFWPHTRLDPLV